MHPPAPPVLHQRPTGLPVYRSTAFAFGTAQEYADVLGDRVAGYSYSRIDNPTADTFAAAVAALEGAHVDADVVGQPFASGMAAISTVFLTLCRAGSHVVVEGDVYGGTTGLVQHVLSRFGVTTTFVDITDHDAVRAAVRPGRTALLYAETIANPTTTVADIPALAAIARDAGIPLVVDSTFATPVLCRPLEHGADLVVHSATKFIGGHGDATGGVVVGDRALVSQVRLARVDLGGSLAPDEAFLLHRGLATLPVRMARHCDVAFEVANALVDHPAVERVDYPGLPEHPSHPTAAKLFDHGRAGGVVTVTPRGGYAAGMALCDRLRLASVVTSLGGTETRVSHVASTTHRQLDEAALARAGIPAGAVRVSIGLEDADDLIADLVRALEGLSR